MTTSPFRQSRPSIDIADAAMLTTVVIWAGNNVVMKAALGLIDPLAYVAARFAIAAALLFAWLLWRRAGMRVEWKDWPRFLFCGITGFALYNLLFTIGLDHSSAFSVSVLVALGPVFALLITAALHLERVRPMQSIGVGCALIGVGVFVGGKVAESQPAIGDLIAIVAAASFAAYSLATRPIVERYGSPLVTGSSALIGLVVTLPFTAAAVRDQDWLSLGPNGWAALLYSSAVSMLLAYTIWGWAIQRRGVGRTVPFLYLVPVVSGLLAFTFLDEAITWPKVAGAVLVLAGVGLARRSISIAPATSTSSGDGPELVIRASLSERS